MKRQIMYAKIEHTGFHPRLHEESTVPQYLIVATGYTDLEECSYYNSENHTVVEVDIDYFPYIIEDKDWYWDNDTESIQDS